MKYIIILTSGLAVIGIPFLLISEHFIDGSRFITMGIVVLASVSMILSLIVIGGRFIGCFKASDFWISLVALLAVSPILLLFTSGICVARSREERAKKYTGDYNLKLLGEALIIYAKNCNDKLPLSENWCNALIENSENITIENFRHPQAENVGQKGECHFAFNTKLSNISINEISDDTILIFEADGPWNLAGTSELIKNHAGVDRRCISVYYMNGKIRSYWFYENGIRFIDKDNGFHYRKPRWNP